jgi:3'(2'), 5'-bisphosphate nucleotidase
MRLCEAVRAQLVRGDGPDTLDKQDRSPVTIADFGSQALVCRRIRESFPDDPIVAEERSAALREPAGGRQLAGVVDFVSAQVGPTSGQTVCDWIDLGGGTPSGRYWVLDPIDGTRGFLRGDQYAIALALIEAGQVQWGFLGCPLLPRAVGDGALFVARRGAGGQAYARDGRPLGPPRVSEVAQPAKARLAESFESAHTNRGLSAELKGALGLTAEPLRMDSQAKYAVVACGRAEIYLRAPNVRTPDYRENIWDHAAGWLVVQEAGGRISDVYGRPLDWSHGRRLEQNIGVLATNGRLHEAVLESLARLLPPLA